MKTKEVKPPTKTDYLKELERLRCLILNFHINESDYPYFHRCIDHIRDMLETFKETPTVKRIKWYLKTAEADLIKKKLKEKQNGL